MLHYGILFITLAIITTLILKGIEAKSMESRVLFQLLPVTAIHLLPPLLMPVKNIPVPNNPDLGVASLVMGVTATYALVAVGLLTVIGAIRGYREEDGRLLLVSIFVLLSLVFMSITHPAYQVLVIFILGIIGKEKWKERKMRKVEKMNEVN